MTLHLRGKQSAMNEGWFKSKKFDAYQKEIGFEGKDGKLNCNYALIISNPILYEAVFEKARPLSDYLSSKGVPLNRPPQNMFHVELPD